MDKRVNELRDRLWKKKAALQQKESLPVSGRRCLAGHVGSRLWSRSWVSSGQRAFCRGQSEGCCSCRGAVVGRLQDAVG